MLRRLTPKHGNTRRTPRHLGLGLALTLGLTASTLSACSDDDFGRDGSTATTSDLSATVTDLAKSTDLAVVVDMRASD
jgi:hypothetical protein